MSNCISSENFLKSMKDLLENRNDITSKKFEEEINNTKFLSPIFILNPNNKNSELKNNDITFIKITDAENQSFFLAFTDWEKFNKFKKDNKFDAIEASIEDFHHMLTEVDKDAVGFVINIGDEALFIPRDTIV